MYLLNFINRYQHQIIDHLLRLDIVFLTCRFQAVGAVTLVWTRFRIENDAWTFVLIRPLPCHLNRMTSESILNNSICEKKERIIFWWLCWLMQSQFQSVFLYVFSSENTIMKFAVFGYVDWIQNQFLFDFHIEFR